MLEHLRHRLRATLRHALEGALLAALRPETERLRRDIQALQADLQALRREMEADRVAFQHANEQVRQADERAREARDRQLLQTREMFETLDLAGLISTLEAAVLTIGLDREAALADPREEG